MLAACEAQTDAEFKPTYHKNMKDPMTIYARHAMRHQTKDQDLVSAEEDEEETQVADPTPAQKAAPTVQATSQASRRTSEEIKGSQEGARVQTEARTQATSPVDSSLINPVQTTPMTAEEVRIEEKTRKAKQHSGGLKIFSGNGNMLLAMEIAKSLGINLGKATVGRFADGEVNVVIHENVRGKDVYVIQPTCTPVNDNLMELLLMVSTLRRASARRITVVIPYYGYARQDRKMQVRYPIALPMGLNRN
jgi:N-terminal domain of ribose phosphate pyrophosphokinase